MKIYCNIDTDKRKFEGRTQLATKITSFLKEQGFEFTLNPAEADLFHFHSSGVSDSYRAYQLKKKYKKPCIYSLYSNVQTSLFMHPINFLIQKIYFQKTATKFLQSYSAALPLRWRSYFLEKFEHVIVPSHYLKRKLFKNTSVITFGVDIDKFKPLKKNKEVKEKEKINVGYFGHPGVFKGLNDFVSASKRFGKNVEIHVFMTERFNKVDDYIRKRNQKIIIHGFTEDIVRAYNGMDIIVLPYRMEIGTIANPLVLLEAMSCGCAIVTTNFPFIKEIVGDSAPLVKRYSPSSLAKAVRRLVRDPYLRKKLGEKARENIIKNYSLDLMIKKYHLLYKYYEKK